MRLKYYFARGDAALELMFPIIMGFSVLLVIGLGIAVKYYKVYWLISGYNTMSKEEKKRVDIEKLAALAGDACIAIGVIMLIGTVFIMLGREGLGLIAFSAIAPLTIYLLIKGQRYNGNSRNPDGTMNTTTKWTIIGTTGLLLVTIIGVGIMFYQSNKPSEFIVTDNYLEIRGLYGEKIPLNQVKEIYLKEKLPKITFKNNGSSIGSKKKGNFSLEGLGQAKLFVDTFKPPFIFMERNKRLYILNCSESEETKKLYQTLNQEKNK